MDRIRFQDAASNLCAIFGDNLPERMATRMESDDGPLEITHVPRVDAEKVCGYCDQYGLHGACFFISPCDMTLKLYGTEVAPPTSAEGHVQLDVDYYSGYDPSHRETLMDITESLSGISANFILSHFGGCFYNLIVTPKDYVTTNNLRAWSQHPAVKKISLGSFRAPGMLLHLKIGLSTVPAPERLLPQSVKPRATPVPKKQRVKTQTVNASSHVYSCINE
jgi:hypothetical protein